jgi:hypothetical protein
VKKLPPLRQRRALSAPGGPVTADGDPAARARLAEALAAGAPSDELRTDDLLTHGFHSYPARLHPLTVRRLLDDQPRGAVLLDPFVGSGTTLVEGLRCGLHGFGIDLNPLAVALTRLKARVTDAGERTALVAAATSVAERSLARVRTRARTRDSGDRYDDPRHYMPHVFRELVGLREEIDTVPEPLRGVLGLVLSSIILKVGKQRSETAEQHVVRTIGKGHPTRLFLRKAEELSRRLADLAAEVPPGTLPVDVRTGDARHLKHLADEAVDVIVTSPPYLGTYDYAEQHQRRIGWLGLDDKALRAHEIGARRRGDPLEVWQKDVDAFVSEFARVLRLRGLAYVVIGDSAVGERIIEGDVAVRKAADRASLTLIASAAQARPNFYRPAKTRTRREHLLMLRR